MYVCMAQEEESLKANGESRGCILLSELVVDAEVEVNGKTFEIVLKTKAKDYQLKAGALKQCIWLPRCGSGSGSGICNVFIYKFIASSIMCV